MRRGPPAITFWFTGLSGSGKTTLGAHVFEILKCHHWPAEHLDGDQLRAVTPQLSFSKVDRDLHVRRVGALAVELNRVGQSAVVSLISPYQESRDHVRGLCENFVEIYLAASLQACERRDVKGLYARARNGEIRNFTGVNDPYQPPTHAELVIDTGKVTLAESIATLTAFVEGHLQRLSGAPSRPDLKLDLRPPAR